MKIQNRRFQIFTICLLLIITSASSIIPNSSSEKTIYFSGYEWIVRDTYGGPGPNNWSEENVWVDEEGLHLRISFINGEWHCAEVHTKNEFGIGEYQFKVIGEIDSMHPDVVLGLFSYGGHDYYDEIDIEFTRWGEENWDNGNYTVWPNEINSSPPETGAASKTFEFSLNGTYTTHRYFWMTDSIVFQSLHGHRDDNKNLIKKWDYSPQSSEIFIPHEKMSVFINLWLVEGGNISTNYETEIIIKEFTFFEDFS